MLARYPEKLTCDLAETYHVFDWKALPIKTVATLSCGLREDSRVMRAISGEKHTTDTMLLAAAVDRLSLLVWMQTKDGHNNRNRPASIIKQLTDPPKQSAVVYESPEAFELARQEILKGVNHG